MVPNSFKIKLDPYVGLQDTTWSAPTLPHSFFLLSLLPSFCHATFLLSSHAPGTGPSAWNVVPTGIHKTYSLTPFWSLFKLHPILICSFYPTPSPHCSVLAFLSFITPSTWYNFLTHAACRLSSLTRMQAPEGQRFLSLSHLYKWPETVAGIQNHRPLSLNHQAWFSSDIPSLS